MTFIVVYFRNYPTAKEVVREISKRPRFRTPFKSQHAKGCQTLLKSPQQHFYYIFLALLKKLSWKLLVTSKILGLFVDTLSIDDKCSLRNSENLQQPIQMEISKKEKTFSWVFAQFLNFTSNFDYFEKTDDLHIWCICEIAGYERRT